MFLLGRICPIKDRFELFLRGSLSRTELVDCYSSSNIEEYRWCWKCHHFL